MLRESVVLRFAFFRMFTCWGYAWAGQLGTWSSQEGGCKCGLGRICIQVWDSGYPMKVVGTDGMFSVVFGGFELAGTRFVDQFENGVGAPCVALSGGGEGDAMRHLNQ